jgi:hypothetical protein
MTSFLSILAVISATSGIFLLWLVLRRFFSVTVSLLTLAAVVFGTNYFRWIFFDGATPHNFLFTLFSAIVLLTINWHLDRRWIWLLLMFPAILLACFIHDLSVFILLIPLLYGIHDKSSWNEAVLRIREYMGQYLFLMFMALLSFGLTRFAWFAEPGTTFYFGDPKASVYPWIAANFQLILFSFNKGWLIYTPMMLLVLPGMYFLAERNKSLFYGIFFFFLFWFLLKASHPLWSAGPGFGQRFFIETYPVLALPLGYFFQWILEKKPWAKVCLLILPVLFLLINLFQTWQYTNKIIVPENMNREYYQAVFGKTVADANAGKLLLRDVNPGVEVIPAKTNYRITLLQRWDFDTTLPGYEAWHETRLFHSGGGSWRLCKEKPFSPGITKKITDISTKDSIWLRVSAWLYFDCHPDENQINLVITCVHKGAPYKYVAHNLAGRLKARSWNFISFDYLVPRDIPDKDDEVQIYFWDSGERTCYLDDYTVELFEPEKGNEPID